MSGATEASVYIGLGSNLGDRLENLREAARRIDSLAGTTVTASSPVYESEPWGYLDQPHFLNAVLELSTSSDPIALFHSLKEIERGMGRLPAERNHPRLIDLDILLFGDRILDTDILTIPHPRMRQRGFVLRPLCDIAPALVHPVLHQDLTALLHACEDTGVLRVIADSIASPAPAAGG
jgi:2-amino-4-hydroxy-6-hydroxymethyldihydropteridine diphosphokinase